MITRGKVIRSGSREALKDIAQQHTFILTAPDTDGRFEWVESVVDFGGGPPTHIQYAAEEVFTVLEGEVKFKIDDELIDARPGDTLYVPRGVPHTFTNVHRDQPARLIGIYTPAGLEAFLRMWHEVSANGVPDKSTRAELVTRYQMEPVGPPLPVELGLSGEPH